MTTDNQVPAQTGTEQPESYSSEDLPGVATQQGAGTAAGADGESPPSPSDAPLPAASDPRLEEAEKALGEERARLAETTRENEEFRRRDENSRFESQVTTEVRKRQEQLIASNWGGDRSETRGPVIREINNL